MSPKADVTRHGSAWLVETFPHADSPPEMHALDLLTPVTFRKDIAASLQIPRTRLERYRRGVETMSEAIRDRIRRHVVERTLGCIEHEIERLRNEPYARDFIIADIYCYSAALSVITDGRYSFLNTEYLTADDVIKGCGW